MNSTQSLLIRADANTHMGTGHLMRCIALAQAWQAKNRPVTFITACDNPALLNRLQNEEFNVVELPSAYPHPADWQTTQNILTQHPGAWVVLDGYHFEPAYQLKVKTAGHPLLIIDDTAHLDFYHADILLNQNINASQLTYRCKPHVCKLLGTQYALLRREFWPWRSWQRDIPTEAGKVLVTLGGGDPDNQTFKVMQALKQVGIAGLEAMVVVGASNPHWEMLQTAAHESQVTINLVRNVTNMPELMAWADVAIAAGGSTCWELAMLGLPMLLIVIADNQRGIAAGLDQAGVAINLGWFERVSAADIAAGLTGLMTDHNLWQQMSHRTQTVCDGWGSNRVVQAVTQIVVPVTPY